MCGCLLSKTCDLSRVAVSCKPNVIDLFILLAPLVISIVVGPFWSGGDRTLIVFEALLIAEEIFH